MTGDPVALVYLDLADMSRQCPNLACLAPPNEYCRRPDGAVRRVPCVARIPRFEHQALAEEVNAVMVKQAIHFERNGVS